MKYRPEYPSINFDMFDDLSLKRHLNLLPIPKAVAAIDGTELGFEA